MDLVGQSLRALVFMFALLVWLSAVTAVSGARFVYARDIMAKVVPDYGNEWFDKPIPNIAHGRAIGKPFLPDKQSPYKVFDADAGLNAFNTPTTSSPLDNLALSPIADVKSVTRSTEIADPKLSETINGDTFYGINNDRTKETSPYDQPQNDDGVQAAKGLPFPSDLNTSNDHIEEDTRVVEQPLHHMATISHDLQQSDENSRTESESNVKHAIQHNEQNENNYKSKGNNDNNNNEVTISEKQQAEIGDDQHNFDRSDMKHDDELVQNIISHIKDEDDMPPMAHLRGNELEKNIPLKTVHETTDIQDIPDTSNSPDIHDMPDQQQIHHTSDSTNIHENVDLNASESHERQALVPVKEANDKPPVLHISEDEMKLNNPLKTIQDTPGIPEQDAMNSEKEALNLGTHFHDTFPQSPESKKIIPLHTRKKHKGPRFLQTTGEDVLSEILRSEHEGQKHRNHIKGNIGNHHHITIDTDTGQIVNENSASRFSTDKDSLADDPLMKPEEQRHETSKNIHRTRLLKPQHPEDVKSNFKSPDARHTNNPAVRHHLHRSPIPWFTDFLDDTPTGIHRRGNHNKDSNSDESLKLIPGHGKKYYHPERGNDVYSTDPYSRQYAEAEMNKEKDQAENRNTMRETGVRKHKKRVNAAEISEIAELIRIDHKADKMFMPDDYAESEERDETDHKDAIDHTSAVGREDKIEHKNGSENSDETEQREETSHHVVTDDPDEDLDAKDIHRSSSTRSDYEDAENPKDYSNHHHHHHHHQHQPHYSSHETNQYHHSMPDMSDVHTHEDETLVNNDYNTENEEDDYSDEANKKSSREHPRPKHKKQLYPSEPKILKQHELIEPSFMLHEDPHGDGMGNGMVEGLDLGTNVGSNGTHTENERKSSEGNKRETNSTMNSSFTTDGNTLKKPTEKENDHNEHSDSSPIQKGKSSSDEIRVNKIKGHIKNLPSKFISNIGTSQDEINVEIDTKDLQKIVKNSLMGISKENDKLHALKAQDGFLTSQPLSVNKYSELKKTVPVRETDLKVESFTKEQDKIISSGKDSDWKIAALESNLQSKALAKEDDYGKFDRVGTSTVNELVHQQSPTLTENTKEMYHSLENDAVRKTESPKDGIQSGTNDHSSQLQNYKLSLSSLKSNTTIVSDGKDKNPASNEPQLSADSMENKVKTFDKLAMALLQKANATETKLTKMDDKILQQINMASNSLAHATEGHRSNDKDPSEAENHSADNEQVKGNSRSTNPQTQLAKPLLKYKLLSNIQEHLNGFEIEDLNEIQDQLKQLHARKISEQKVKDGLNGNSHLDLDVTSGAYNIPDHQLTLPIVNPGHPDESNGIPATNGDLQDSTKLTLVNPHPTEATLNQIKSNSHDFIMSPLKTENAFAKNSISRHTRQHTVKVTGKETLLDSQAFIVASKTVSLIGKKHGYNDVNSYTRTLTRRHRQSKKHPISVRKSLKISFPTYKPDIGPIRKKNKLRAKRKYFTDQITDRIPVDIGDSPDEYVSKQNPTQRRRRRHLLKITTRHAIRPIKRSSSNYKYEYDMPLDLYNARQYFIKELVDNFDKPKNRKRVLSIGG